MSSLADVRTALFDLLDRLDVANVYRRVQRNYQYPAVVIGWPQEMDVRASMDGVRRIVLDVTIGVEVLADEDSADEALETLLGTAVDGLLAAAEWDVLPVTDFGEQIEADAGRVVLWCRLPVAVFA